MSAVGDDDGAVVSVGVDGVGDVDCSDEAAGGGEAAAEVVVITLLSWIGGAADDDTAGGGDGGDAIAVDVEGGTIMVCIVVLFAPIGTIPPPSGDEGMGNDPSPHTHAHPQEPSC